MPRHLIRSTLSALLVSIGLLSTASAQESIQGHLETIDALSLTALQASQEAETAASIGQVKAHADEVFHTIWGQSSGLAGATRGAATMHGWKTRWQTTGAEFDEDHVDRYGAAPPAVGDPSALGIVGRGRRARKLINAAIDEAPEGGGYAVHGPHVIAALNNVIGWMRLDEGVTKAERQPRVGLTYVWDAPSEFWTTTADTGWLHEVFAQAINILKTNYAGDVNMARSHAAAMTQLIQKCRGGVDADGNGSVDPVMMEGGIATALQHAAYGGMAE